MRCICSWKGEDRVENKKCPVHFPKKKRIKKLICTCEWEDGERVPDPKCPVHKKEKSNIPSAEEQLKATTGMSDSQKKTYAAQFIPKRKKPEFGCVKCNGTFFDRMGYKSRHTGEVFINQKLAVTCKRCNSVWLITLNGDGDVVDKEPMK
jgi:Zn finger protein HypA/HybF involved in hydrogenase expression